MDKVQKHNSFSTNIPSSESYRNDVCKYLHWTCFCTARCTGVIYHTVSPFSVCLSVVLPSAN